LYEEHTGRKLDDVEYALPPAMEGSRLPSTGTVKVLTLLISFSDYPESNTQASIHSKLFGDGDAADYPYESLKKYYNRSSYGQLSVEGNTLG